MVLVPCTGIVLWHWWHVWRVPCHLKDGLTNLTVGGARVGSFLPTEVRLRPATMCLGSKSGTTTTVRILQAHARRLDRVLCRWWSLILIWTGQVLVDGHATSMT